MDSLTQIVLGAAVAEVTIGHKIGRKAALYGSLLGTLPDLDVLWVKHAVESFTEHRSFSHSLLVLFPVVLILAVFFRRWHPHGLNQQPIRYCYWVFSIYAMLATHALLDAFTIYGTQLLWPITHYPFGIGSIFIIDPLYTLPLLICLLFTVITRKRIALALGLGVSCAYLLWSLCAQHWQSQRFEASLKQQGIQASQTLTLPMPLNTLLWKNIALAENGQGYWISFSSIFDDKEHIVTSRFFQSDAAALMPIITAPSVKRLRDFTKGFYQVKQQQDQIWFSDLRMGGFGNFVFNFNVGQVDAVGVTQPIDSEQIQHRSIRPSKPQMNQAMGLIGQRIFDQNTDLFHLFEHADMLN